MFDVTNRNRDATEVIITAVSFEHAGLTESQTVGLYRTMSDSYAGNERQRAPWTLVAQLTTQQLHSSQFNLNSPISLKANETVGFYINAKESIIVSGKNAEENDEATTDHGVELLYGSAILSGGSYETAHYWNGKVEFFLAAFAEPVIETEAIFK